MIAKVAEKSVDTGKLRAGLLKGSWPVLFLLVVIPAGFLAYDTLDALGASWQSHGAKGFGATSAWIGLTIFYGSLGISAICGAAIALMTAIRKVVEWIVEHQGRS